MRQTPPAISSPYPRLGQFDVFVVSADTPMEPMGVSSLSEFFSRLFNQPPGANAAVSRPATMHNRPSVVREFFIVDLQCGDPEFPGLAAVWVR